MKTYKKFREEFMIPGNEMMNIIRRQVKLVSSTGIYEYIVEELLNMHCIKSTYTFELVK